MPAIIITLFFGIGFFLLQPNAFVHTSYDAWYQALAPLSQSSFPENYVGPAQLFFVGIWTAAGLLSYVALSLVVRLQPKIFYFGPRFYHEISRFSHNYFHERLHELERGSLLDQLQTPEAHRVAIKKALYALRAAMKAGYRDDDRLRITLMRPRQVTKNSSDGERVRLRIEYWANEDQQTPISMKENKTLGIGEGFAGRAWKRGVPQIGGKRKWWLIRDARFIKMSSGHDAVKAFCAIPIFSEGPFVDGRPLLGVLNIDSRSRFYFPIQDRAARAFSAALRPLLINLVFHLTWLDQLGDAGDFLFSSNES